MSIQPRRFVDNQHIGILKNQAWQDAGQSVTRVKTLSQTSSSTLSNGGAESKALSRLKRSLPFDFLSSEVPPGRTQEDEL